jgi:hypothetical protein
VERGREGEREGEVEREREREDFFEEQYSMSSGLSVMMALNRWGVGGGGSLHHKYL